MLAKTFPGLFFLNEDNDKEKSNLCMYEVIGREKVAQSSPIFGIPWTMQSMEFSRPEYWGG